MISFGKDIAELHSSKIGRVDFRGAAKGNNLANTSSCDVWTEYHDIDDEAWKCSFFIWNCRRFKYDHYKYWSNPLETKLPNAPDMEIFSLYGVGIPTERAYIYKLNASVGCYIPFHIDNSAEGGDESVAASCIIRVAAGASGKDLGEDQVRSHIFKWSQRINLKL
ncbi:hypothetical protein LIER_23649 [Lithospermum erythrorhizon]|uniref:Uncharacterized protein n=1 Tax=Lithospermum erythrorhizon TaxID=34254 RepID=A0AAV3R1F7_LITER